MSNYAFAGYVDGNLDNTRNYNLAGSSEPPHTLPGPGDNVLLSDDGGIEFEPNFVEYGTLSVNAINYEDGVVVSGEDFVFSGAQTEITANTAYNCELESGAAMNVANTANSISVGTGATLNVSNSGLVVNCFATGGTINATNANVQYVGLSSGGVVNAGVIQSALMDGGGTLNATSLTNFTDGDDALVIGASGSNSVTVTNIINVDNSDSTVTVPSGAIGLVAIGEDLDGISPGFSASVTAQNIYSGAGSTVGMSNGVSGAEASLTVANYDSNSSTPAGLPNFLGIGSGATVTVQNAIGIGRQAGDNSTIGISGSGSTLAYDGSAPLIIGDAGTGTVTVGDGATLDASNSDVLVADQDGSTGSVTVDGSGSTLQAEKLTVGGAIPDLSNPDSSQDGDWTYTGGVGTLAVLNDASVTVGDALTLQGVVTIADDGTETAEGGIDVESGGSIEVGGGGGVAPANTLEIADAGSLAGHGLINSDVTGEVTVSDSTTTPTYSLNIDNGGTIEAEDGILVLDGNLSGDGEVLIGHDSTLEFGGSVADDVTAMFLPGEGQQKIVIDDPQDFNGVISSENFEPGDEIDLPNVPYVDPGSADLNPDGASFYFETGQDQQNYVLQIVENDQTFDIPISQDEPLSGGFTLSDDGSGGTLVTYTANDVTNYSETATADPATLSSYAGVVHILVRQPGADTSYEGSGFAVGQKMILTALHVVNHLGYNVSVDVPGLGYVPGKVERAGFSLLVANDPDADWAYVYVPDANFTSSQIFQRDTSFEGGTVIESGYPYAVNGILVNTLTLSKQYSLIGNVTVGVAYQTAGIPYTDFQLLEEQNFSGFLNQGSSGGPVWTHPGFNNAVGIITRLGTDLSLSAVPAPPTVDPPAAFYTDPPSNDVRITSAVVVQTGDVNTGQNVQFFVNMSENVVVTGAGPTLTLNDGGTATFDATESVGTELVFDYTVGASDQTSNLEVTRVNSGQTVQGPGGASIDFSVLDNLPTGLSINSPLVVTSVASSQTGEVGAGQFIQLTLTMNQAVTVNTAGGTPTLTLDADDNSAATYDPAASNPSTGTLVFGYTVGSGDEAADLEVASVNLLSGMTVQNAAGYNADFLAAINAPTGLQVGPAYITAITASQSSKLTTGQTLQVTLATSTGVTVNTPGGSPTLSLSDGAAATYDAAASNPSAGNLVFDYTVGSGDYTSDLQVLSYNPNGAVVTDAHGVDADFSGATQYDLALDVNAAIVTNLTVSPASGEADAGQQVTLALTMSEAVTVNLTGGSPTLTLNDGATATYDGAASNPSPGTLVFAYTVGATDETPSLQVSEVNLNGATINDANGNAADLSAAANLTTNLQIGPAFISSGSPSLYGEIFTGQTDQVTLAMSQAVTVNTTNGAPTLSLSDGATATYDSAASDPSSGTLVFDYTVGADDYATDLQVLSYNTNGSTVTDANGVNANFSGAAQDLSLDVNAATVTDVTSSPSSGEADSGAQITVTLTINEAVTVNTSGGSPTLSLSTGATATYDSAASNLAAGTLVFDYTVGAADETPDLSVVQVNLNGATINDGNGNAADLSAASSFDTGLEVGPVFVEAVTPSLSGFIATGQTVQLALGMSAGLTVNTNNGSPMLSLSDGATASYDAADSDPSSGSLVFDYTVGANDHATDLTVLGVNPNGATITDANGVSPDLSGVAQFDPGLSVNSAIVTNVTASPSTGEADSGQLVKLTLAMSEAVTVNTTGGSSTLYLSDGAIATYDGASSNPSAGTLVFAYMVGATDVTSNLQIAQVNLNGATINDLNGTAADLSGATTMATGLQIGPVFVNSLTPSVTGEVTQGQTVQLTVAMSAGVTLNLVGGLPTLTLSNGATATYDRAYSDPAAGTLVFDYTVGNNQQTASLEVTSVNFPSPPQDANGQDANFAGALNSPLGLSVGMPLLPIVTSIAETPRVGDLGVSSSGTLALTINESVTVTGAPTLTLNDGGTATYSAAQSTATSLVFDYTVTSTDTDVSSLSATVLNESAGGSIVDGNGNSLSTSLAGLTQTGPQISITTSPPPLNSAPPAGTTAVMVMSNPSNGDYEIYDVGGNAILAAYSLGQVGSPWTFVGLGTLQAGDTSDMLLRNTSTGGFEAYYISNNNITNAALIGTVGTDWNFAGTGDFDGQSSLSELLLRNSASGSFELYQVAGGGVLSGSSVAAVGNNLQVSGFGNFSGSSTTQMIMEQANEAPGTNAYWLYTYNPSSAAFAGHVGGTVGNNLSVVGFGDLLGNGETQMVMQQNNGNFWLYTYQPSTNSLSGTLVGAIGSNFHVVGFGPLGTSGQDEMLMQEAAGDFEVYQYNATLNAFVGSSMGAVGAPWVVDGIAADPPGGSGAAGSASTAQLVQAMASMGAGAPLSTATGATVGANLPQPTLLTTPHAT